MSGGCGQDGVGAPCFDEANCPTLRFSSRPRLDRVRIALDSEHIVGIDKASGALVQVVGSGNQEPLLIDSFKVTERPSDVLYSDVNGDDILDIVVSDAESDKVTLHINSTTQTGPTDNVLAILGAPLAVAQWQGGDGGGQVLVASHESSSLWGIRFGMGMPTVSNNEVLDLGVIAMAVKDLDNDGVQEIVTLSVAAQQAKVLEYVNGRWKARQTLGYPLAASRMSLGRFDSDDEIDLLLLDDADGTAHMFPGRPGGAFSVTSSPVPLSEAVSDTIVVAGAGGKDRVLFLSSKLGLLGSTEFGEPPILSLLNEPEQLGQPARKDGSIVVVAPADGLITTLRADTEVPALLHEDRRVVPSLGNESPLLTFDFTGDGILDILGIQNATINVHVALSEGQWGNGLLLDTGSATALLSAAPARLNADELPDIIALDEDHRIVAFVGTGDGNFLLDGFYTLWDGEVEYEVADLVGDATSEIAVTRRDRPGSPREVWRFGGSGWDPEPLPGEGGRPQAVVFGSAQPQLVFLSDERDTSAFLERAIRADGAWKLGARSDLLTHPSLMTSATIDDDNLLIFCSSASGEAPASVGTALLDPGADLVVENVEMRPSHVLAEDQIIDFPGGTCRALWTAERSTGVDVLAAFHFTEGDLNVRHALGVFDLRNRVPTLYRSDYIGGEIISIVPLISESRIWQGLLAQSVLTSFTPASREIGFVPAGVSHLWPADSTGVRRLSGAINMDVPPAIVEVGSKASSISGISATLSGLVAIEAPCRVTAMSRLDEEVIVSCDDRRALLLSPRSPPVPLGIMSHSAETMATWSNGESMMAAFGDASDNIIHIYSFNSVKTTLSEVVKLPIQVRPNWLGVVQDEGTIRLLVIEQGASSAVLISPEEAAINVVGINLPACTQIGLADINNDDTTDVLGVTTLEPNNITIFNMSGRITGTVTSPPGVDAVGDFSVWDADCDGRPDLVRIAADGEALAVWRSSGEGSFDYVGLWKMHESVKVIVGSSNCVDASHSLLIVGPSQRILR